jgi:multiple sugar transport system substrate-binding protein
MKKTILLILLIISLIVFPSCSTSTPVDTGKEQYIELSYADWANPELNQKLIDAFMVAYPNIRVTLRTDISGSGDAFTGNLVTAAQAGLLPDVFATDNVPTVINAGLAKDVAEIWNQDEDAKLVYKNIAATGVYNGKRFAVPSFQFLKGIMINLDIFQQANLTTVEGKYRIDNDGYPVKDWTFDEMVNLSSAIKKFDANDLTSVVFGLDTWYGAPDFQQVWPMMDDATVNYDTWDGTKFNYSTSDAWKRAMVEKIKLQILTDGTTTRLEQAFADEHPELATYHISDGTGAMDIEGSWQFWVINEAAKNNINLGFWPYPSGSEGLFPPTILDYLVVSSETDYPEEAFLLAKWMSFGQAGWKARLDIFEENNEVAVANGEMPMYLDRFPIADYPDVWTRVNEAVKGIEGIDATFERISFAKPDLDKWLPGYKDFWSWAYNPDNPYNFDSLTVAGPDAVPTYAKEWETMINSTVTDAINNLGK